MDISNSVSLIISIINSLLVCGIGIYFFAFHKKPANDEMLNLNNLINKYKEDFDEFSVNIEHRISSLENLMTDIEEQNRKNSNIFKTVLYGCDMIVQGCKSALQIDDFQEIEKKLVNDLDLLQPNQIQEEGETNAQLHDSQDT